MDKINQVRGGLRIRNQALIAFLYLTGCRVEEVVKYRLETNPTRVLKKREVTPEGFQRIITVPSPRYQSSFAGHPIYKKQIEERDNLIIIRNVRTLKRRTSFPRNIPIIKNKLEEPLIKIIKNYTDSVDDETPLFPFSRQWSAQILEKVGLFNHWLRHIRLTHLVTDYGFNGIQLQHFTGWADTNPSKHYVHLNIQNLIRVMSEAKT